MGAFIQWFQNQGAYFDAESVGIIGFPLSEGGRGAVALKDIPSGHTLFTIPRSLIVSTRTCVLPRKFGLEAWRKAKLHQGWVGLILCLMWETAAGSSSKWAGYLDGLPNHFDTPMFWDENDLLELKGTSVVEKLGKADAEADYNEILLPAVKSRPDLFLLEHISTHYSIERYHIMGSRILSRSFIVEEWNEDGDEKEAANTSLGSAMDVDEQNHGEERPGTREETEDNSDGDDDDDDDEGASSDVAMVPMADILNARYKTENAKLFYEKDELKMVSTKPIRSGEQIWNTYGDLPNAELLRRYGHVDFLSLPSGGHGNPGDVVEIKADLIVSAVSSIPEAARGDEAKERIDWWLEQEGSDDVFILDYEYDLPLVMVSFVKLLLLSKDEWEKAQKRSKPPKSKLEGVLYDILVSTLEKRLDEYPTTVEMDKAILAHDMPLNKRNAIIVRLGEKEVLQGNLQKLKALKETAESRNSAGGSQKRKGEASGPSKAKKSRR